MNNNTTTSETFSPSKEVWRTHMERGEYPPHRVSCITCVINQLLSDKIVALLYDLNVKIVFIENARNVRETIKSRMFGLPGTTAVLQNTPVSIFRFTLPRKFAKRVMECIIKVGELHIPGRGTVFSQNLMEFSKDDPPVVNVKVLSNVLGDSECDDYPYLKDLAYVICVLSEPGSGEIMAKAALDLGICVPYVTFGTGNDIRDQLGLIRITISPQKEIVHLVMPAQDSDSIIGILLEQGRLDRPGRGFIYQTPISIGLIDTRIKIGKQSSAASIEQIIAAIDQLKSGTSWRKRLDAESYSNSVKDSFMPHDNCEISIITEEDRIDKLREACLKVGATGATTSRIKPFVTEKGKETTSTMVRSAISVPATIICKVVDVLLEASTINKDKTERIQILDSPSAYVHSV